MKALIEGFLLGALLFCPFGLLALLCGWGTQETIRRGRQVWAALCFLPIQTLLFLIFFLPSLDSPEALPIPWLPISCLTLAIVSAYLAVCVLSRLSVICYGQKKTNIGMGLIGIFLLLLMLALGYYFRNMS